MSAERSECHAIPINFPFRNLSLTIASMCPVRIPCGNQSILGVQYSFIMQPQYLVEQFQ